MSERTDAERERDRLERELRRAPGGGRAQPDPPAQPNPPPPVVETEDWLVPPVPLEEFAAARQAQRRPRGRGRIATLAALAAVLVAIVLLGLALRPGHQRTLAAPKAIRVLIPEGETRVQIEAIAKRDGLSGSYLTASRRSSLIDLKAYGAPRDTPDLEGFLFPATYDLDAGARASLLVEKQLVAFGENFGRQEIGRARELHVTPYQLLIVASMVEREAEVPGDRAKIAAVIYNRLRANMPLGIDATIYYAIELARHVPVYTRELTEAELHMDSPYNTRVHTGLPPTPIANPGLASIEAAAHPAHVSYLYYVAGADGCGEHVFSNTAAEFEANAAAYQAAVRRNGGHPPTCKRK